MAVMPLGEAEGGMLVVECRRRCLREGVEGSTTLLLEVQMVSAEDSPG